MQPLPRILYHEGGNVNTCRKVRSDVVDLVDCDFSRGDLPQEIGYLLYAQASPLIVVD